MYSLFHGAQSSIFALGVSRAHDGLSAVAHHVVDIFEVDVDVARHGDDLGYTFSGDLQHIVGLLEGVGELHVTIFLTEFVVAYHEKCVDMLTQLGDTFLRLLLTTFAFEAERQCDDTHCEYSKLFCYLSHDGSGSCACTATHTGCDKQHLGVTFERLADLILGLLCCLTTFGRDVTGS